MVLSINPNNPHSVLVQILEASTLGKTAGGGGDQWTVLYWSYLTEINSRKDLYLEGFSQTATGFMIFDYRINSIKMEIRIRCEM